MQESLEDKYMDAMNLMEEAYEIGSGLVEEFSSYWDVESGHEAETEQGALAVPAVVVSSPGPDPLNRGHTSPASLQWKDGDLRKYPCSIPSFTCLETACVFRSLPPVQRS